MLNMDDAPYFEQSIPVSSLIANTKIAKNTARPDLQFFPEGGKFLAGVNTKVAFKAIGPNGRGIDAKGIVSDDAGNEVAKLSSAHLGMGYFYLKPSAGKAYTAKVVYADNSEATIPLPAINDKGIVLTANIDSLSKIALQIAASNSYFNDNRNKGFVVDVYSAGVLTTFKSKLDDSTMRFDVQTKNLHTGVCRITLSSAEGEPLSERLVFIHKPDLLKLSVSADKNSYNTRDKVSITLNAKDKFEKDIQGDFSVAVINESIIPVDENEEHNILTNMLLTSELKGTVEQPNYYFNHIDDKSRAELDLVMLTHGYRSFEWKKTADNVIAYPPENGLKISGTVRSLTDKAAANGTVNLLSQHQGIIGTEVADGNGNFKFKDLLFTDTANFILQAVNKKGKNTTQISYDTTEYPLSVNPAAQFNTDTINITPAYSDIKKRQKEQYSKLGFGKVRMLKEVNIRAKKPDNEYRTASYAGAGHADQVMHADELERIRGPLSTSLNGRLRGVRFKPMNNHFGASAFLADSPMLVVIDGLQLKGGADIDNILASDVETIEVLKYGNAAIYGMDGGVGVLVITTKQGSGRKLEDIHSTGILPITAKGFYKAREFYVPKYTDQPNPNIQDLRTTIFWKPQIITTNGNAAFDYFNADTKGTYRVIIEGMDAKGNIGRQVLRYQVQ